MTKAKNTADTTRPQHNKAGAQQPTQRNEPHRTDESRDDRTTQAGSSNQNQQRRGKTAH